MHQSHDPNDETWGEVLIDAFWCAVCLALLGVLIYAFVMVH